jgi:IclR family KDG regulon transcriptional repressor
MKLIISDMKKNPKNRMVPALARGLSVLELLAKEESELTLRSISERLGIPTPSLWRILCVLRNNGYVLLDPDKKTYRLGFKFLYLGNILLNEMGFRSEARAYLKQLVDLTGETAELSARVKDQLILIDQVEGPEAIRLFSRIGSSYPYFHATAPGKVYLSHLPSKKLKGVMDRMGLPRITEFTISSLEDLQQELKKVRTKGYAFDHQEMRVGVSRVAAPVYGKRGDVVACLGVAGPSFRITTETRERIGKWTKELAQQLSVELKGQASIFW